MTSQDWKQYAPCKRAESPALFDVPSRSDTEGWDKLRATATRWCKPCPLLLMCAADPDAKHGLWGGSARWERQSAPQWEPLFEGAPEPQLARSRGSAFSAWLPQRKRGAA